jgi:hypothetical protein
LLSKQFQGMQILNIFISVLVLKEITKYMRQEPCAYHPTLSSQSSSDRIMGSTDEHGWHTIATDPWSPRRICKWKGGRRSDQQSHIVRLLYHVNLYTIALKTIPGFAILNTLFNY